MKKSMKITLLVALAVLFILTACNRQASRVPVASPTPAGEVPFPVSTEGVGNFGTQTAVASTPGAGEADTTTTPVVVLATATGEAPSQPEVQVTSAPGPAVSTPVIARPTTYSLQKGEWPICIARRYNLDIPSFFSANGLNMNSKPAAGTTLKVPASGSWNPTYGNRQLRSHPTSYTVVAGDSVYSIACRFGDVAPESILAVNGMKAGDVTSGKTIKIP